VSRQDYDHALPDGRPTALATIMPFHDRIRITRSLTVALQPRRGLGYKVLRMRRGGSATVRERVMSAKISATPRFGEPMQ